MDISMDIHIHGKPVDRAMTSSYRLPIVTMSICSGLGAMMTVKFLPAAVTHVRRITVSYPSVDFSV